MGTMHLLYAMLNEDATADEDIGPDHPDMQDIVCNPELQAIELRLTHAVGDPTSESRRESNNCFRLVLSSHCTGPFAHDKLFYSYIEQ